MHLELTTAIAVFVLLTMLDWLVNRAIAPLASSAREDSRLAESKGTPPTETSTEAGAANTESHLPQDTDLYKTLFNEHPDCLVLVVEGKIALANDRFAELTGYSTEEAIGIASGDVIVPEQGAGVAEQTQIFLKGLDYTARYTLTCKDGTSKPVVVHSKRVQYDGKPTLICAAREIPDQQAEETLRETEARLDLAETAGGVGTLDWDIENNSVKCSDQYFRLFGIEPSPSVSREALLERVHEDDVERVQAAVDNTLRHDAPFAMDYRIRWPDGSVHWISDLGRVLKDGEGRPVRFFRAITDITERKDAEEALRQSEARFSTAFHDNPVPVAISRVEDGKFIDVNDALLSMTGFRRSETIGRTPNELGLLVDSLPFGEAAQIVRERGTIPDFPGQLKKKTGEVIDVLVTITQIELEGASCLLTTMVDITERRRLEHELQEMRDDLGTKVEREMDRGNSYRLTFREFTVLHLIAAGKADKEIAAELGISIYTVHRHVSKILAKMESPSRTEAGTRALREGLLD